MCSLLKVLWWFDYGDNCDVRSLQPLWLLFDLSHESCRHNLNIMLIQAHLSSQNSYWRFVELFRKQVKFPAHIAHISSSTAETPRVSMSFRNVASANLASWDFGMQVRFDIRVNWSYNEWLIRIGIWMRGWFSGFLVVIWIYSHGVFRLELDLWCPGANRYAGTNNISNLGGLFMPDGSTWKLIGSMEAGTSAVLVQLWYL